MGMADRFSVPMGKGIKSIQAIMQMTGWTSRLRDAYAAACKETDFPKFSDHLVAISKIHTATQALDQWYSTEAPEKDARAPPITENDDKSKFPPRRRPQRLLDPKMLKPGPQTGHGTPPYTWIYMHWH